MTTVNTRNTEDTLSQLHDSLWDEEYSDGSTLATMETQRANERLRSDALQAELLRRHPESAGLILELERSYSDSEDIMVNAVIQHSWEFLRR